MLYLYIYIYIIYEIGDLTPTGEENKADTGGCVYLQGNAIMIQNSNFSNCQAKQGGGLAIFNNDPQNITIRERILYRNMGIVSGVQVIFIIYI